MQYLHMPKQQPIGNFILSFFSIQKNCYTIITCGNCWLCWFHHGLAVKPNHVCQFPEGCLEHFLYSSLLAEKIVGLMKIVPHWNRSSDYSSKTCHFYYIPVLFVYNEHCSCIFEFLLKFVSLRLENFCIVHWHWRTAVLRNADCIPHQWLNLC